MKRRIILGLLLLACLALPQAAAVGLSSYNSIVKEVDFQPGKEVRFQYRVTQTTGRMMDYSFEKRGDMSQYLSFDPPFFKNAKPGDDLFFDVFLSFPPTDEGLTPGIHIIYFGVAEQAPADIGGGMGLSATTSVETGVKVRVLSSNKSAQIILDAKDVNEGGDLVISAGANSWTKTDISESYMSIRILDENGNAVRTFVTEKLAIPPGQRVNFLPIMWSTLGQKPGTYNIEATLYFDGFQTTLTSKFRIGTLSVTIDRFTTQINAGRINQMNATLVSNWNLPIEGVYYILESKKANKAMTSATFSLKPFNDMTIPVYWDAAIDQPGNYDMKVTVYYEGKQNTKAGQLTILPPGIEPTPESPMSFTTIMIIIAVVIILVVTNAYWFLKNRKKEHHGQEQTKPPEKPAEPGPK